MPNQLVTRIAEAPKTDFEFLKTLFPLVREQAFQGVAHLLRRTLAQAWSFSPYNLQLSLASKAMFFGPAAYKPRSPSFFGLIQLVGQQLLKGILKEGVLRRLDFGGSYANGYK
nr:hypothetical protein CFP56_20740 [Quercus suber]